MDNFPLAYTLLIVLFTAGLVTLAFALYFEVKSDPPALKYVTLGLFAAGLTIAATFIAALIQ